MKKLRKGVVAVFNSKTNEYKEIIDGDRVIYKKNINTKRAKNKPYNREKE